MDPTTLLPRTVISAAMYLVVLAIVWMIVAVGIQMVVQVLAKKPVSRWLSGAIATGVVVILLVIGIVRKTLGE